MKRNTILMPMFSVWKTQTISGKCLMPPCTVFFTTRVSPTGLFEHQHMHAHTDTVTQTLKKKNNHECRILVKRSKYTVFGLFNKSRCAVCVCVCNMCVSSCASGCCCCCCCVCSCSRVCACACGFVFCSAHETHVACFEHEHTMVFIVVFVCA